MVPNKEMLFAGIHICIGHASQKKQTKKHCFYWSQNGLNFLLYQTYIKVYTKSDLFPTNNKI